MKVLTTKAQKQNAKDIKELIDIVAEIDVCFITKTRMVDRILNIAERSLSKKEFAELAKKMEELEK